MKSHITSLFSANKLVLKLRMCSHENIHKPERKRERESERGRERERDRERERERERCAATKTSSTNHKKHL